MGLSRGQATAVLVAGTVCLGVAVHANSWNPPATTAYATTAAVVKDDPTPASAAPPAIFVATVDNEYSWRPDWVPAAWPKFTKLPDAKPLPAKTARQKVDMATAVNARWQAYSEKKAKTYPSAAESGKAIEYLLTIDPKAPEFSEAWAAFIKLRQADRSISTETAMDGGRKIVAERAKDRGVNIGMTADQVRASSWGKPRSINETLTARGKHEQWVYNGGYLYLQDGFLTSIQTTR